METILYQSEKFEVIKEHGSYFVIEKLNGEVISESMPLCKEEINEYLVNNGYEMINVEEF